jgi:hypothetical protein
MDPHSSNVPDRQTFIRLTEDPGLYTWVLTFLPAAARLRRAGARRDFCCRASFAHGSEVRSPRIQMAVYTLQHSAHKLQLRS